MGRRRLFPRINTSDWQKRGGEERAAVNSIIQGSAADIIKVGVRGA
jgi:DNA polymerase I-like protein with 3'-5' exonuclease and polymerase domains